MKGFNYIYVALIFLCSCIGDYPNGPFLTFQGYKERVNGEKKIVDYKINGVGCMDTIVKYGLDETFTFRDRIDNQYSYGYGGIINYPDYNYAPDGYWSFGYNTGSNVPKKIAMRLDYNLSPSIAFKDSILPFAVGAIHPQVYWNIMKLDDKEMLLKTNHQGKDLELLFRKR